MPVTRSHPSALRPARAPRTATALAVLGAVLGAGVAAVVGVGCAGSRTSGGYPARVSLMSFEEGWRIELRSETHTPPVELYSERRERNDIKVTTDEVMASFVEYLKDNGFEKQARGGAAPRNAAAGITRALEIEVDGRIRHLLSGPAAPLESSNTVSLLTRQFIDLFNRVQGFQQVDTSQDAQVFVGPGARGQPR